MVNRAKFVILGQGPNIISGLFLPFRMRPGQTLWARAK